MNENSFLPEDDQDFLRRKAVKHQLLAESLGGQERKGIEFLDFEIPSNLYQRHDGRLVAGGTVSVLVLIPPGYPKARLDSWYIWPGIFLSNNSIVDRAGSEAELFGKRWQFWSRHLQPNEWRPDADGLETYLQYIKSTLRKS